MNKYLTELIENIKDKTLETTLAVTLVSILSIPMIVDTGYIHSTTTSIKKYEINVDSVFKSGYTIPEYATQVSGDTTGIVYIWNANLKAGKNYKFSVRKYGFFGETNIENLRETKK